MDEEIKSEEVSASEPVETATSEVTGTNPDLASVSSDTITSTEPAPKSETPSQE